MACRSPIGCMEVLYGTQGSHRCMEVLYGTQGSHRVHGGPIWHIGVP